MAGLAPENRLAWLRACARITLLHGLRPARASSPVSAPPATENPLAPELSLVVPTYNERGRIAELAEAVFAVFRSAGIAGELVIVDDNSPDGTGDVADELARRFRVRVVHRAGKLGLGSAVMEGFTAAEAPIVGVMDADFSHPPDVIPRLLARPQDLERGCGRRQPLRRPAARS